MTNPDPKPESKPLDDVVPYPLGITVDLGATERIAANLNTFRVWPTGFQCRLSIRIRPLNPGQQPLPRPQFSRRAPALDSPTVHLAAESNGHQLAVIGNGNGTNGWIEANYWVHPCHHLAHCAYG
jgi:hypothetical protein